MLLKKFNIYPNAYYNYLKNRKQDYKTQKDKIKNFIYDTYHKHNGVDGYRTMHAYLIRSGYKISRLTVHNYMNTEMKLYSITRRKRPNYEYCKPHKIFENKLNQEFHADKINQKWCTDFTYLDAV